MLGVSCTEKAEVLWSSLILGYLEALPKYGPPPRPLRKEGLWAFLGFLVPVFREEQFGSESRAPLPS